MSRSRFGAYSRSPAVGPKKMYRGGPQYGGRLANGGSGDAGVRINVDGAVGDAATLVSVGGVSTAEDVRERLDSGATLVQAYTGFVYGGPWWPRRVVRGITAGGER